MALLSAGGDGCLKFTREADGGEVRFGVEVVFSGLIDDADKTVPLGAFVGQLSIEFTDFEVIAVIVAEAKHELGQFFGHLTNP